MRLEYKCRRCGVISNSISTADKNVINVMVSMCMVVNNDLRGIQASLIDIHNCSDGGMGLADCIGCSMDNAPIIKTPDSPT